MRSCLAVLSLLLVGSACRAQQLPKMKFNDVREVAPGVFFRYSSISPTNPAIFGGCNNIWIVFKDYVVVFDANFPKEAGDVLAAIKKTTDKPVRYVIDSHHHGDHAYGNAVFAKAGATVISQANCAQLLRTNGPKEFAEAGNKKSGRKDIAASFLKVPDLIFNDKLVLDDGTQRVELLFLGHCHTAGDCFAYLPKHKILCTGDACVNGAYNFMGHSDSAAWIRNLEKAQQLDVKLICPGHGPLAGKELLATQRRWFVELRQHVKKAIAAGRDPEDIAKDFDLPWYKEWTGVEARDQKANIEHVYAELTGRIMPWDLVEDFGIYEGPSPTKDTPGWTKPKRIVVPNLMPTRLAELKRVAPDILFVPVKTAEEAAKEAGDADAVLGFCTADVVKAGGDRLRWIQVGHAGVEKDLNAELKNSKIVLTNTARIYGPNVADQAFALLLNLTRGTSADQVAMHVLPFLDKNSLPKVATHLLPFLEKDTLSKDWIAKGTRDRHELNGKTVLIVGLGGIGTQIARRADAFGMRVMAIEPKADLRRPDFVLSVDPPARLMEKLPQADVVVLACPLTDQTRRLIGAAQLKAMKKSAYLINIARGGLVRTADLVAALKAGQLAGAGLDVTDPEPLPRDHPLRGLPNVVISPHVGGQSPEARDRQWRLWRENVRRFVSGEPLVCVVNKTKGY
jgi:phosphoglycerate dehydrogenase-like enzyme/glyoxylase-like metal-dependent hydrolase (beta-lactamase superfamily II)